MPYDWKNQVVLITGGASGIGELVVRIILNEGVKHVAVLDIAEALGKALETELNTKYGAGKVKFYKCDVTDEKLFLGLVDTVKNDQGYIDVFVNNAGIMNDSPDVYKKAIAVNVNALIAGTLKAIEIMRKDKGGRGGTVVNVSSIAGLCQKPPILPIYYATKSAVLQFSTCIGMNDYFSKYGVRVLTICFSATATSLVSETKLGHFDPEFKGTLMNHIHHAFQHQSPQSAAQGVVDAFKLGESGSTWLSTQDLPIQDISGNVEKAYEILSEKI